MSDETSGAAATPAVAGYYFVRLLMAAAMEPAEWDGKQWWLIREASPFTAEQVEEFEAIRPVRGKLSECSVRVTVKCCRVRSAGN